MSPKGFWSYARGDDEHLDQRLTALRQRIAGEISLVLGQDITMFQDVHDIRTGDDWAEKLRAELTTASFLVPVLTPRYFARPWCREETLTFLRLARESGREPLLFPVYFVGDDDFDAGAPDEVRTALRRYQYLDWRPLRFESDPTRTDRAIHDFATDVKRRLKTGPAQPPRPAAPATPAPRPGVSEMTPPDRAAPPPRPVPTLVVDPWPGRGDHTTIGAAIKAAAPGSRLLIRPGTYVENLTLDKTLELIGEGGAETTRIECATGDALHVSAPLARLSGLGLHRRTGAGENTALWLPAGRAEFDDCEFSSQSLAAIEVAGPDSAPTFRRCTFRDSAQSGALIHTQARGLFEECRFAGNRLCGVEIISGADPTLRRCVLADNALAGIFVYEGGRGVIEECEISGNERAGIATREDGAPTVQRCQITRNGYAAVRVSDATGGGRFIDNDLRGNTRGAWDIAKGAEKNLVREGNKE